MRASHVSTERTRARALDTLDQLERIARRTNQSEIRRANMALVDSQRAAALPAIEALQEANKTFGPVLRAMRDRAAFDRLHMGAPTITPRPAPDPRELELLNTMRAKAEAAREKVLAARELLGGVAEGLSGGV